MSKREHLDEIVKGSDEKTKDAGKQHSQWDHFRDTLQYTSDIFNYLGFGNFPLSIMRDMMGWMIIPTARRFLEEIIEDERVPIDKRIDARTRLGVMNNTAFEDGDITPHTLTWDPAGLNPKIVGYSISHDLSGCIDIGILLYAFHKAAPMSWQGLIPFVIPLITNFASWIYEINRPNKIEMRRKQEYEEKIKEWDKKPLEDLTSYDLPADLRWDLRIFKTRDVTQEGFEQISIKGKQYRLQEKTRLLGPKTINNEWNGFHDKLEQYFNGKIGKIKFEEPGWADPGYAEYRAKHARQSDSPQGDIPFGAKRIELQYFLLHKGRYSTLEKKRVDKPDFAGIERWLVRDTYGFDEFPGCVMIVESRRDLVRPQLHLQQCELHPEGIYTWPPNEWYIPEDTTISIAYLNEAESQLSKEQQADKDKKRQELEKKILSLSPNF